jgi:hypothetical protein
MIRFQLCLLSLVWMPLSFAQNLKTTFDPDFMAFGESQVKSTESPDSDAFKQAFIAACDGAQEDSWTKADQICAAVVGPDYDAENRTTDACYISPNGQGDDLKYARTKTYFHCRK